MTDFLGKLSRRKFLESMAALSATALAVPNRGFSAEASPAIKLGFDNFSIRAFDWKAPQLIEYAASQNVDVLLLSDLEVYESFEETICKKIREQAQQAGIELQVGTGSICPTSKSYNAQKWGAATDHARLLDADRQATRICGCSLLSRKPPRSRRERRD